MQLMADKNIGLLVVMEHRAIVGVLSERGLCAAPRPGREISEGNIGRRYYGPQRCQG
jgi:hypothetical protein